MGNRIVEPIAGLAGFDVDTCKWERPCPACGGDLQYKKAKRPDPSKDWPIAVELRCVHGHKVTIEVGG